MDELGAAQENEEYLKNLDKGNRRTSMIIPKPPETFDQKKYIAENNLDFEAVTSDPIGRKLLMFYMESESGADAENAWMTEFIEMLPNYKASPGMYLLKHILEICPLLKKQHASVFKDLQKQVDEYKGQVIKASELRGLLDPLETKVRAYLKDKHDAGFLKSDLYTKFVKTHWAASASIGISSFEVLRPLGKGAFGMVSGAKMSSTGKMFAMKAMNKKVIKGKKAIKFVKAEKKVLAELGEVPSPFVLSLHYSFDDPQNFYLILPLLVGGDLDFHMKDGGAFSAERACVYTLEIALGLQHLHDMGFIYRDLKPENILMAQTGRCAISDLGLAVDVKSKKEGKVKGRAGTPGYWAPEVINKKPYNFACDWWGLGVCLFEFHTCCAPFDCSWTGLKDRNAGTLAVAVGDDGEVGGFNFELDDESKKKGMRKPTPFSDAAKEAIRKMLHPDPEKRLGSKNGVVELHELKFFEGLDFGAVIAQHNVPPFVPDAKSVNAMSQEDIDSKGSDVSDMKKLVLEADDNIPDILYVNRLAHNRDIAEILTDPKAAIKAAEKAEAAPPPTIKEEPEQKQDKTATQSFVDAASTDDVLVGDGENDMVVAEETPSGGGCCSLM